MLRFVCDRRINDKRVICLKAAGWRAVRSPTVVMSRIDYVTKGRMKTGSFVYGEGGGGSYTKNDNE